MSNLLRLDDYRKPTLVKSSEVKKVSLDDGYTQIPNELLDAILTFDFSNSQRKVVLAIIRKTLSWRKDMDWICNEQLAEMANLSDVQKASRTKNELIRMNVLVQDGRKIGLNLIISEWKKGIVQNDKFVQNDNGNCTKQQSSLYKTTTTKETTTKETITKENNPLPPNGESANAEVSPLAKNQNQVQVDNSQPAGKKTKSKSAPVDYQGVVDLYNQHNASSGGRLPEAMVLNDKRRRAIKRFMSELSRPELSCVNAYFQCFFESLSDFYLGKNDRGWVASFDYAIRSDTVTKVREGTL